MTTTKIHLFAEHCTRAGMVATESDIERLGEDSDDLWTWEGSEAELREQAEYIIAANEKTGASGAYQRKCARAVLEQLS